MNEAESSRVRIEEKVEKGENRSGRRFSLDTPALRSFLSTDRRNYSYRIRSFHNEAKHARVSADVAIIVALVERIDWLTIDVESERERNN